MNKELEKKLIEDLKQLKTLEFNSNKHFLNNEAYKDINAWQFTNPFFEELHNIERVIIDGYPAHDTIFFDLQKLKNLKEIYLYFSEVDGNEDKFFNGLIKISKLEALWLVGTQLNNFPEVMINPVFGKIGKTVKFNFPKLTKLGLIGNKFYKQNFHFKMKEGCADLYNKIQKLAFNKKAITDNTYKFENKTWGLINDYNSIIILKDDFISFYKKINSISVYILNNNDKDRHETFKVFYDLFTELNKELNCFETDDNGNLDVFFYYKTDYNNKIELEKLKQLQKDGIIKYENEFISDLLIYLGGEQLITDIANEHIANDKDISKEFYDNNNLIQSIKIENFKQFEQETLNNLDDINIIVGKNGAGKTSLLQAIAASLIPHKSKDIENLSSYINIKLKDKPDNLRFARTVAKWSDFKKAQRFFKEDIQLETNKGKEIDLPQSYLVLAYGENLYAKKHPFEEYGKDYQDILVSGTFQSYFTKSIFTTSYEYMANPLELFYELSEGRLRQVHKKNWTELLELAKILKDKLNDFLEKSTTNKFKIKQDGAYYKFYDKEKKQFLEFEQISEGYRSYIVLLTDIIMRILAARKRLLVNGFKIKDIFTKVKGAIIIDEFDKHMHPSWQRIFLKTLKEEFPQIQFFLSTHNIVSLQSAEGEKVFVLSEKDGEIDINNEILSVGNTIEEINSIYFDGKIYSDRAGVKIEEFSKLKRLAIVNKNEKYLNEYIEKAKSVKKEFKEQQSESFVNALNIDIAYLKDFFKKQKND